MPINDRLHLGATMPICQPQLCDMLELAPGAELSTGAIEAVKMGATVATTALLERKDARPRDPRMVFSGDPRTDLETPGGGGYGKAPPP